MVEGLFDGFLPALACLALDMLVIGIAIGLALPTLIQLLSQHVSIH